MAILQIVKVDDENPVLREEADPVATVDGRVRRLMDDMIETMRDAPGVGLAAPQIGLGIRVIVVETPRAADAEAEGVELRLHAMANPRVVWCSEETKEEQEACLSIPDLYGDVPRHVSIRVVGLDRDGRQTELELHGFDARVFQHEIDHLDGILFTDRVTGFEKLYRLEQDHKGEWQRVPYAPPLTW